MEILVYDAERCGGTGAMCEGDDLWDNEGWKMQDAGCSGRGMRPRCTNAQIIMKHAQRHDLEPSPLLH